MRLTDFSVSSLRPSWSDLQTCFTHLLRGRELCTNLTLIELYMKLSLFFFLSGFGVEGSLQISVCRCFFVCLFSCLCLEQRRLLQPHSPSHLWAQWSKVGAELPGICDRTGSLLQSDDRSGKKKRMH